MLKIVQEFGKEVLGVLSGFDRLVFRGSLRGLSYVAGMKRFLSLADVPRREFSAYVNRASQTLKDASVAQARALGRPIIYLRSSLTRKEAVARKVLQELPVREGLICALTCVEPCKTFHMYRNAATKQLELVYRPGKCLFVYHYYLDPVFGFMNARIQTWFPFPVQICVNGHEWLTQRMEEAGLHYTRQENSFTALDNPVQAQKLMGEMLDINWPESLDVIAARLNPAHNAMLGKHWKYYWTAHQTEWSTDILFRDAKELGQRYPALTRGAISAFSAREVFRFLGKQLHVTFTGEATSHYVTRPEGVCVKHRVNANTIKMYDKAGSILRVETTINAPGNIKTFRPCEGQPGQNKRWRPLRKGVADLHRRAQVSQRANERYLDALADFDTDTTLAQLLTPVCRRIKRKGRLARGLRPWAPDDHILIATINRPEFLIDGFRNRDLSAQLFPKAHSNPQQRRAASAKTSYRIRLLRAHGLIAKLPNARAYRITAKGRQIAIALLLAQNATVKGLNANAA
jgi:hypothetical protein